MVDLPTPPFILITDTHTGRRVTGMVRCLRLFGIATFSCQGWQGRLNCSPCSIVVTRGLSAALSGRLHAAGVLPVPALSEQIEAAMPACTRSNSPDSPHPHADAGAGTASAAAVTGPHRVLDGRSRPGSPAWAMHVVPEVSAGQVLPPVDSNCPYVSMNYMKKQNKLFTNSENITN